MASAWTWLAASVAIALAAPAATHAAAPAPPGYTMPSTHMWDITARDGQVYRIFVSFPEVEAPKEGFPVLYVLDGNAMFAGFAETRRIQEGSDVGKSIIVGVGYPGDKAYDGRRLYDLTGPTPPPSPWDVELAHLRSGGWDKFLAFLTSELRTEIGKRYKTNPARQSLFGHSLGGLFAIHALFTKPDAFHAIIAASPTLFWHDREMLKAEEEFANRLKAWKTPKVARLMIVAGDREETALELWDPEAFARRMEPLSAYGLRTRSETYVGEGHMTVPNRATAETLRFAFSWP